jgi:hypothetical protein
MRKRGERQFSDERVPGSGEFVEEVLGEVGEAHKEMVPIMMRRADARELLERQCAEKGLSVEALQAGSRSREYSSIRREPAGKFVFELGLYNADAGASLI